MWKLTILSSTLFYSKPSVGGLRYSHQTDSADLRKQAAITEQAVVLDDHCTATVGHLVVENAVIRLV